ncbi:peptidase M15 [Pseudodesulfovibrio sp. S3]|nr:M15 family metallopeptidase [Pseudodesulfovibrio sp. S3-i]RWU06651.1 peptidase M15 [Pseudodesulfovibrio sp. S3]
MTQPINPPSIPKMGTPSWETVFGVEIRENNEDFVPLSLAENQILVRPAYYGAGIDRALPECYARDSIRKRLLQANALLPEGLRLIILDSWRSKETQVALFGACSSALAKAYPDKDEKSIKEMTEEFVAPPSLEKTRPSPHATGGAVDLTIATTDGVPLFFGAPFDYPGPISNTRYFEECLECGKGLSDEEEVALSNRRLLFDVMTRAGFVNYHGEWWHFEYGTQRWAYVKNRPFAFYGPKKIVLNSFSVFNPSADSGITTLVTAGG